MPVRSLRRILFQQSILVTILPFLIASALVVAWLLPQIDGEIAARQSQLGRSIASQVDEYLISPMRYAEGSISLMLEKHPDQPNFQHVLDAHLVVPEALQALYVTSLDGRILGVGLQGGDEARRRDLIGLDLSRNPLFLRATKERQPLWSDTFLSLVSGGLSVAFAFPSEQIVMIGEVDLGQVTRFLQRIAGERDQLIFVIDNKGQIVADQDGHFTAQQLNISNIPLVNQILSEGDHQSGEFEFEGRRMLGSLTQIHALDWHVLVAQPVALAYETVWTSLRITLASLFGALFFATAIAFYMTTRSARIFEKLAAHARQLASDQDLPPWPRANIREFQDLAANLQAMSGAIRERERQLLTLMSNLPGMAYRCQADDQRTLTFVSEGCLDLVGLPDKELLNDFQGGLNALMHPEDLAEGTAQIEHRLRKKQPYQIVYRLRDARGLYKWGMDHGRGVWDEAGQLLCIEGLVTDITAQRLAEEALKKALADTQEARDRVELILRSVADGLIFIDMGGRVVLLSASAEALLGLAQQQSLGMDLAERVDNQALREHLARLREYHHETSQGEFELWVDGGNRMRTIQVSSALVKNRDGVAVGIITLLRDVSRERELDRIKSEFISTAAHELRTPLTVIMGFAEVLQAESGLTAQQSEYLGIIVEKSVVLQRLIDDLLDLGRVESGKLVHVEKERCDICAMVGRVVADFKMTCPSHRFEITRPEHPIELSTDPLRLAQVMENLLGNAVKFSPAGSPVKIVCRQSGNRVQVAVQDQGIGMTAEQADKIFDKFYRVDSSSTAKQGLGLGMTIVKNIVEAHEGRIWVESAPERGTTVTFEIPLGDHATIEA